ncbi:sensor histidine kinase [Enterovirga sp. CN4-39]|uniref:sensor histidine kinase n=1 Tax=Enterovirga sp. CN4-39 TaxID=3400910 RepID=UPI003C0D50E5
MRSAWPTLTQQPEQAFDDIVAVAAELCHVPIALLGFFTDESQWFKAWHGFEVTEIRVADSLCAHLVDEADELVVVRDLAADTRSQTKPWVADPPHFRFYVALPLRSGTGQVIGTLCLTDYAPRPHGLTSRQADGLRALGRQVTLQLELRRQLQEQTLLRLETQHRLKNTWAVVQGLAVQTLRTANDLNGAKQALLDRLAALGRAHDAANVDSGAEGSLRSIAEAVLAPYKSAHSSRIQIEGPDLELSTDVAQSFALALHELATNALKYGALSNSDGAVAISWSSTESAGQRRLRFTWEERNGPPPSQPQERRGFGTRMIEGIFGRGTATFDFKRSGLVFRAEAPLKQLVPLPACS